MKTYGGLEEKIHTFLTSSLDGEHIDLSVYTDIPRALRTFGARATFGHIVTLSYLYKFGLSLTPVCWLCQQQDETLQHILKNCTVELPDVKKNR